MKYFSLLLTLFAWTARAGDSDFAVLEKAFSHGGPAVQQNVFRRGNKTIEVECYVEVPGQLKEFERVARDLPGWREWAFTDINQPAEGDGDYLLQLLDAPSLEPGKITALYYFNLIFFKKDRTRTFNVSAQTLPGSVLLRGESILSTSSALKSATVTAQAFPAKAKKDVLWIFVRGRVEFRSGFFYEALPERILLRELGDRLTKIASNFKRENDRIHSGAKRPPLSPPDLNRIQAPKE